MSRSQLYSIKFSHYNEAARWALEYAGISYVEYAYAPMLHMLPVAYASRGGRATRDTTSSPFSTPLFIIPDGTRLHDSADIIQYANEHIYATQNLNGNTYNGANIALLPSTTSISQDNIHSSFAQKSPMEMIQHFRDKLGPNTRRLAYYYVFQKPDIFKLVLDKNFSGVQWCLARLTAPMISYAIQNLLRINEKAAMKSLKFIRQEFDIVANLLANQAPDKQFLMGGRFSAVDLYFACMAAPALGITQSDGYSVYLPPSDMLSTEGQRVIHELRNHPAGKHALKMFQTYRHVRAFN